MPREWNTPLREPWNPVIHSVMKAIDNHTQAYFRTGDPWHLEKAQTLRVYILELKEWIHSTEQK
jgi:hypothetical protein